MIKKIVSMNHGTHTNPIEVRFFILTCVSNQALFFLDNTFSTGYNTSSRKDSFEYNWSPYQSYRGMFCGTSFVIDTIRLIIRKSFLRKLQKEFVL